MKKLLLVAATLAAGFAFGYYGACVISNAWENYKGKEDKDKKGNNGGSNTVSRNEKIS